MSLFPVSHPYFHPPILRPTMAPRKKANPLPTAYPGKGMQETQWNACLEILTGVYNAKDGRWARDVLFGS